MHALALAAAHRCRLAGATASARATSSSIGVTASCVAATTTRWKAASERQSVTHPPSCAMSPGRRRLLTPLVSQQPLRCGTTLRVCRRRGATSGPAKLPRATTPSLDRGVRWSSIQQPGQFRCHCPRRKTISCDRVAHSNAEPRHRGWRKTPENNKPLLVTASGGAATGTRAIGRRGRIFNSLGGAGQLSTLTIATKPGVLGQQLHRQLLQAQPAWRPGPRSHASQRERSLHATRINSKKRNPDKTHRWRELCRQRTNAGRSLLELMPTKHEQAAERS
jgi:hypothetical protein